MVHMLLNAAVADVAKLMSTRGEASNRHTTTDTLHVRYVRSFRDQDGLQGLRPKLSPPWPSVYLCISRSCCAGVQIWRTTRSHSKSANQVCQLSWENLIRWAEQPR